MAIQLNQGSDNNDLVVYGRLPENSISNTLSLNWTSEFTKAVTHGSVTVNQIGDFLVGSIQNDQFPILTGNYIVELVDTEATSFLSLDQITMSLDEITWALNNPIGLTAESVIVTALAQIVGTDRTTTEDYTITTEDPNQYGEQLDTAVTYSGPTIQENVAQYGEELDSSVQYRGSNADGQATPYIG